MTNTKGENLPSNASSNEETTSAAAVPKSEFLEKVSEIPVVNVAKEFGSAAYNQVKNLNKFTNYALSTAETAALFFAINAKPYLDKVQPQAQMVDHLACRGLTAVEEKAPFILKPPEELIDDARKLCTSTVEMGYQKVEEMKNMGTETLSSVKNYGLQKANDCLAGTEEFVEKYLPPAFGEGSPEAERAESHSVQERASKLTSKIGLRVYGHGIKLLTVHKLGEESVAKLVYTIDLLQHLKENYANRSVQEYVDEAKTKATWIWSELNKEPAEATETQKSLEQRMLSLARRMTSVLVHAYNVTTVPLTNLPQTYKDGLDTASKYAAELFSQFDQATNAGEATVNLLQGAREKLVALENIIQGLTKQTEEIEMDEVESSVTETESTTSTADCETSDKEKI